MVWGKGWETGAFQRAEQPCSICGRDLGGGMRAGVQVGGVQFPEHHPPPFHNLPPFPKKKAPEPPSPLSFCPQISPTPSIPPPHSPNALPPFFLIKFVKMQPSVLGFLESRLDMFRSTTEDLVSSGRVTVNCGRSTRANGGALGS